jgi:hypothetical protein
MEDCPCQSEDTDQDNKVHPGKSAFDFRSTQLCGSYFHFDGNPKYFKASQEEQPDSCDSFKTFLMPGCARGDGEATSRQK